MGFMNVWEDVGHTNVWCMLECASLKYICVLVLFAKGVLVYTSMWSHSKCVCACVLDAITDGGGRRGN